MENPLLHKERVEDDKDSKGCFIKEDEEILSKDNVKAILKTSELTGKRVCEKIDDMLNALNDDLYAYYYWEDEESSDSDKLSTMFYIIIAHKYCGKIWLYRGLLAERLNRIRMAERAYQRVLEKGWSLYSFGRLIEIYKQANNPKGILMCVWNLLKYFNKVFGINTVDVLPGWIEDGIFNVIAKNGFIYMKKLMNNEKLKPYVAIENCLLRAGRERVYNASIA